MLAYGTLPTDLKQQFAAWHMPWRPPSTVPRYR